MDTQVKLKKSKTQAEYYEYFYRNIFAKLTKHEQERILRESKKPPLIVRGTPIVDSFLDAFIKSVVRGAEKAYEESQAENEKAKENKDQSK